MKLKNESGSAAAGLVVVLFILLIGAIGFGAWAYSGMNSYKNDTDQKIADAVVKAKQQEDAVKDAQYAQTAKSPYLTYTGPSSFGSITIQYPRTWSVYAGSDGTSDPFVDTYFDPLVVPKVDGAGSVFALRLQVVGSSYSDVMQGLQSNVDQGTTTVAPYQSAKVPGVIGSLVKGQISDNLNGTMVVLPLRDKTLELWTETNQYQDDFNSIILPNFSFSP